MRLPTCISLALLLGFLVSCAPLPATKFDALAPYRAAMRPEAKADVELMGEAPRYDIVLSVDPDQFAASGHESVLVTNRQTKSLKDLYFRLYPNLPHYDGDLVVTRAQMGEQELGTTYEAERSALRIALPAELRPGRTVRLDLDFRLKFKHKETGQVLFGDSQGILSLPDSYPVLAVCENGVWDLSIGPDFADASFSEASLYRVSLTLPKDMVAATSGVVTAESDTPEGRHVIEIVTGPIREFGLIMSRTYRKQTLTVRGIEVNSFYQPADEAMGYSALWRAVAAVQTLGDVFAEYPYLRLNVAEAPLGKHGMEYPGLALIGSDVYRTERLKLEPLVVHETAHQWWYNIVGSDPINSPVTDESLAEYSLLFYYKSVYGPSRAEQIVEERWAQPLRVAQASGLDAPVEQRAAAFNKDNYEVIVYAKSALLLEELRNYIGDDAFELALRRYVQNYRYRIAPAGALLGLASGTTAKNLESLSEEWRQAIIPTPQPTVQSQ